MFKNTLAKFESTQKNIDVVVDDRKQGTQIAGIELFQNLADKCAGVKKVYSDYDQRRASRPYQTEDYCWEKQCRYRRDQFSASSTCESCRSPLTGCNTCSPHSTLVCDSCTVIEPCEPSVPCEERFRRNVISSNGTWKKGYEEQQKRHHLLVGGREHDLLILQTYAAWNQYLKKELRIK